MPSVLFTVKEMARVAYSQSENIKLVDETTNDDPWGPTGAQMDEVCRAYAFGGNNSQEILKEIVLRLENRKDSWRRCYKSLLLLDHMARTLSDRYVRDLERLIPLISTISRNFNHTDSKGVDQGSNIRERAKKLLTLLQDRDYLTAERQKSAATAAKVGGIGGGDFGGIGGGGGGGGGGRSSGRFSGTGSSMNNISAEEGGNIANRQNTYGVGGGSYDAYAPARGSANSLGGGGGVAGGRYQGTGSNTTTLGGRRVADVVEGPATCHPSGRPFTKEEQEEADMAYAARLQQEEEMRAGTRVTDTDIGRRMANEGRAEREARELAEFNRRQAQMMAARGGGGGGGNRGPPSNPTLDAEAQMALELQARLDRGEDMASAIAAITAKFQSPEPQQQQTPPTHTSSAVGFQSQPPASVVDPFAPSAVQQQHPSQKAAGGKGPLAGDDLDFFADIPQGTLGGGSKAPAGTQTRSGGGVDDFFSGGGGGAQTSGAAVDFFGGTSANPNSNPSPARGGVDFFGNASPNTFNNNNNKPVTADDFFATASPTPPPASTNTVNSSSAMANDPFSALTQAQQSSLDALSGGQQKRQPQLGGTGGGLGGNKAPVW